MQTSQKSKIKMVIGSYRDTSFVLSSEKHLFGSDEGAEEMSTNINNTITNYEQPLNAEDGSSPR